VVGVNTAIFSPNGGNIGIGFAIPAAQVQPIVDELLAKGHIERGWLGVNVQEVTDELASGLGLDAARGALVASVVADSPAAQAGVMAGDVIVGLDGRPMEDVRELVRTVGESDPGDAVELEVWREGQTQALRAHLATAEGETGSAPILRETPEAETASLGLRIDELDITARRRYRVAEDVDGVIVTAVARDSEAARRGLRPGDVIVGVGQSSVNDLQGYEDAVERVIDSGRDTVVLQVLRGEARTFVPVPVS